MIRKLLITIFCAATVLASMAQDTRPFEPLFVEGKTWKIQYDNFIYPEKNDFITYTVHGDTIVEGCICKRLEVRSEIGKWNTYYIPVYENGGKSFAYYYNEDRFSPLCDFSVKPGDVVELNSNSFLREICTVNSIKEIEIRGYTRRKVILGHTRDLPSYPSWETYWIEGIGSIDQFDNMMTSFEIATNGGGFYFVECSLNGEVLLTREDMGLAGVDEVRSDSAQKDGVVYDIYGRRVKHPQRGQIYIRDGKKFVQR